MQNLLVNNTLSNSELWQYFQPQGMSHQQLHTFLDKNLQRWKRHFLGKSYEGREVFSYSIGNKNGERVLIWSQMHGNEPFSTYALVLAMQYLDQDNELARRVLDAVQLIAIPMLNPDGSAAFTRRNAQAIDINRDALRRVSPEAQILVKAFETVDPEYCLNLHDQEVYYSPRGSDRPTAMAFLVPAADSSKSLTNWRKQGMDILGYVTYQLRDYSIAKYDDSYMPNAFGDYFSSQGAVTMLFETGFIIGDSMRRETTLLHALSILNALHYIVEPDGKDYSVFYERLQYNQKHAFFDFIMKNVILNDEKHFYRVDLAVNRNRLDPDKFVSIDDDYFIFDIGDLRGKKAFVVKDFEGKLVLPKEKIYMYAPANWLLIHFK